MLEKQFYVQTALGCIWFCVPSLPSQPCSLCPFDQPAQLPEFPFPAIKSSANQSHETQIPPGLGTQAEYPNHKVRLLNSGPGLFILAVGKHFIDRAAPSLKILLIKCYLTDLTF